MRVLVSACCAVSPWPDIKPARHILKRSKAIRVYVVITPGRVFTFTAEGRAEKFLRRARRCPSMRGQEIDLVRTVANGSMREVA